MAYNRIKLVETFKIRLPDANVTIELMSDYQLLVLLLNEDLKEKNITVKQIEIKYGLSRQTARTLRYIVINKQSDRVRMVIKQPTI
jgi:hypothetical protein